MPINRVKDRAGRPRFEFEFSRRLNGRRVRVRKLLPAAWSRAKADAFDRTECGRLYAESTGVEERRYAIDEAVARYNGERAPGLKDGKGRIREVDLMADYFVGEPLERLPEVCAEYLKDHRATLAPATIRNRLRYLTAACRFAWKHHGMGKHDPAERVVMPAVSNEKQVYISRKQMLQLARKCRSWEVRAMIRISFYSGMRLSEIKHARVVGGDWVLDDTKNGLPRIVPMDERCRPYSDYLWPSKAMVAYWMNDALAGLDLPAGVTFHTLRHSCATALIEAKVSLYTVGAVLGHKSAASTKRYAHHATQSLREAVGRIGRRA